MYCKKKEMIYLSSRVRVKRAEQSRAEREGANPATQNDSSPSPFDALFDWLTELFVTQTTLCLSRDVSRYEWHGVTGTCIIELMRLFALYFVTEKMLNVMFIFTTIS